MSLKAAKNVNNITPLEAGSYPAQLLSVIDLGIQPQSFKGEEKKPQREIMLWYELADEFLKDENGEDNPEKPRVLSERFPLYPLSSERAKSTQRYSVMDPQIEHDGDFSMLVGVPVMLTVIQNPSRKNPGVIYNNIAGIAPMRAKEADKMPELVNDSMVFDLEDPDIEKWGRLHEWVQNIIKGGIGFNTSRLAGMLNTDAMDVDLDEDEPF